MILKVAWRYRLTVRTEPSQGLNTGSTPVSATKSFNIIYLQDRCTKLGTGALPQRPGRGAIPDRTRAEYPGERELSFPEVIRRKREVRPARPIILVRCRRQRITPIR